MNNYTIYNNKEYVLTIHDLPQEDKPREKLIKHGPQLLSVAELIAVVFLVGTKNEDVLAMASRVIKEYGERSFTVQKNVNKMSQDLKIPLNKAAQIVACAELGRRFFQKNDRGVAVIRTPKDVHNFTKEIHDLTKENMIGIYLDAHNRVIHSEILSIGTVDTNIVHPREVFKPALEYCAAAVILAHNHPSGISLPSLSDLEVTRLVKKAGETMKIELLDHVVVTKEAFKSII